MYFGFVLGKNSQGALTGFSKCYFEKPSASCGAEKNFPAGRKISHGVSAKIAERFSETHKCASPFSVRFP
jgi:hypothetical protein